MKKRILSLFLALAMVATAAVVPGTSAEAAYEKGDTIVTGSGLENFTKVDTGDRTTKWFGEISLKVGDILTYEEPTVAKNGEFRIKSKDEMRYAPANLSNISLVWVKREVKDASANSYGDWEVAGEGLTYTIQKDDMSYDFAVLAYTKLDKDDQIVSGTAASGTGTSLLITDYEDWDEEEIINQLDKAGVVNATNGAWLWVSGGGLKAVLSPISAKVEKGKIKKELFSLSSAKSGAKSFGVIGNDLFINAKDITSKTPDDIKIIFDVVDEATKDVLARADKASKSTDASNDPLFWNAAKFNDEGKLDTAGVEIKATDMTSDNSKKIISGGAAGVKAGDTYRIYVGRGDSKEDGDGKYYTLTGSAVKTDYNINIIADDACAVLYMGEMKEGESVVGTAGVEGDGQTLRYIAEDEGRVTLPEAGSLRKQDEKGNVISYLQGWSTYSNTGALIREIEGIKLSSNKVYYAVWGATEPEMVHRGEPVYRVYNAANGEHLYTSDINEYKSLVSQGWNDEGIKIYGTGGQPSVDDKSFAVRRMYNANTGEHIYVEDASNEMNTLARLGWTIEAVIYVSPAYGDPVYRLWNGQAGVGCHLWTMDTNEVNVLRTQYGWAYEGTPFNSVIQ